MGTKNTLVFQEYDPNASPPGPSPRKKRNDNKIHTGGAVTRATSSPVETRSQREFVFQVSPFHPVTPQQCTTPPPNKKRKSSPGTSSKHKNCASREEIEGILGVLSHNNVYKALSLDISMPKNETTEHISGAIETIRSTFHASEEEKVSCVARLNVIKSLMKTSGTRTVYIETVNCYNSSGLPIVLPRNEVMCTAFLSLVVMGAISTGHLWTRESGFPVRLSADSYAWVDGGTLVAKRCSASSAVSSVLRCVSTNLAFRGSEIQAVAECIKGFDAWPPRHAEGERHISYRNGMLGTDTMTFTRFSDLKATESASPSPPPLSWPFSVTSAQDFTVTDDDVALLSEVRAASIRGAAGVKSASDLHRWLSEWDRIPCMVALQEKMPLYQTSVARHSMTACAWNRSTLFRALSRGIGCVPGRPGDRVLVIMGPSGCAKSTCLDVVGDIVGEDKFINLVENSRELFSMESTVGKNLVIYSDVGESNAIPFERLSNASDRHASTLHMKYEKNVVCAPSPLTAVTSNHPKVIKMPKGKIMDGTAIKNRVLPYVFDVPLPDGVKDTHARKNIHTNECFYITLMMMAHCLFAETVLFGTNDSHSANDTACDPWKATEDAFLSNDMKDMASWFSQENVGETSKDNDIRNDCADQRFDRKAQSSKNMKFWKNVVNVVVRKDKNSSPP